MITLGIESTCDETAVGIVKDQSTILANVICSQAEFHSRFGGVFPEHASRRHSERIIPAIKQALEEANLPLSAIDLIAVANEPGLIGSLLVGLNAAKTLSLATNIPLIGVNHIQAHLYAALIPLIEQNLEPQFPAIGCVISGGHTSLYLMESPTHYQLISHTVDDAIGEAFDKIACLLGHPYPGGPKIEQLAKQGDPNRYPLKAGQVKSKPLHFSFSGLKTNVLYIAKGPNAKSPTLLLNDQEQKDLAASFQKAALTDIIKKSLRAAQKYHCKTLLFGGGVSQSQSLRTSLSAALPPDIQAYFPPTPLCMDNGAMIAALGAALAPATQQQLLTATPTS
ncbi:MAG: tRNA N6-adenosine threonylcarbamoyltransferase [Chlamydiia bacterium]|nr:tRNA N6-adenosine threonylcarbamoyltransferase [Chlamydiia bacterium]